MTSCSSVYCGALFTSWSDQAAWGHGEAQSLCVRGRLSPLCPLTDGKFSVTLIHRDVGDYEYNAHPPVKHWGCFFRFRIKMGWFHCTLTSRFALFFSSSRTCTKITLICSAASSFHQIFGSAPLGKDSRFLKACQPAGNKVYCFSSGLMTVGKPHSTCENP